MRILKFDFAEFENPSTEEWLEIAIAAKDDFFYPNVEKFVASAVDVQTSLKIGQPVIFSEKFGYGADVREYLLKFANFSLPSPCAWPTYVLPCEDYEDDIVLCGPEHFVRYYWGTSG
jgi:hypothetical protein